MVIKAAGARRSRRVEIDLGGPEGNAFCLLGYAKRWAAQLGRDPGPILADMKSGNYEHLLSVFEREFGDFVVMYRPARDEEEEE